MNPVLTEVEPDDANIRLPTQEWVASPGGGFTPSGTGAGGKVHKAALRRCVARAQPYARRPLTCAVVGVLGGRLEGSLALTETTTLGCGYSIPPRFHFDSTSIPPRFHRDSTLIPPRFHLDSSVLRYS